MKFFYLHVSNVINLLNHFLIKRLKGDFINRVSLNMTKKISKSVVYSSFYYYLLQINSFIISNCLIVFDSFNLGRIFQKDLLRISFLDLLFIVKVNQLVFNEVNIVIQPFSIISFLLHRNFIRFVLTQTTSQAIFFVRI